MTKKSIPRNKTALGRFKIKNHIPSVSSIHPFFLLGSLKAIDQPYIAKAKEKKAGTSANIPKE